MKVLRAILALTMIGLLVLSATAIGVTLGLTILLVRPAGLILSFLFVLVLRTKHWIFLKHMQMLKFIERFYPWFP